MDLLVDEFRQAFGLLASGNAEIRAVLWLSLLVSSTATLVALLIGVPAGVALALGRFPGRRLLISAVNAGMGLPPVVVGLFVTILLWRSIALGASRAQMVGVVLREARLPMLAAVMAGFGAVISEIGASLMVGGNIKGQTRTLTTAMVLETSKGNFDAAIALAVLLLQLIFLVNWGLTAVQQRRAP